MLRPCSEDRFDSKQSAPRLRSGGGVGCVLGVCQRRRVLEHPRREELHASPDVEQAAHLVTKTRQSAVRLLEERGQVLGRRDVACTLGGCRQGGAETLG